MTYLERHKASGFKVGDIVRVTKVAGSLDAGWQAMWDPFMCHFVGKKCEVVRDADQYGFRLVLLETANYPYSFKEFSFPYFVMELVDEKKESVDKVSATSDWNTTCQRCGAPAYQGLFKVECSKGCK